MTTQTIFQDNYLALTGMVKRWERRRRWQQTLLWLPRLFVPGLVLGIVLAVISRLQPLLLPDQLLVITGAAVIAGLIIGLIVIWLSGRSLALAAQRFDVMFGLNERVSTALELIEGRIR
ncbi:MAG: hypothetical protein GYB67_03330, partial [Chloroflexi bacterium]|nr:hypothetical protein [Chloroflexota bacterium]